MKTYLFKMHFPGMQSPVWRHIAIAQEATFTDLAEVMMVAGGYQRRYDWEFLINDIPARITNQKELLDQAAYFKHKKEEAKLLEMEDGLDHSVAVRSASETPLAPLVERYKTFRFLYDFTDEWLWDIELMEVLDDWEQALPLVVDGLGTAPFEDTGDIDGHYEVMEALAGAQDDISLRQWMKDKGWHLFDKEEANKKLQNKG